MTTIRVLFVGGPCDGQVSTLIFSMPRQPPESLFASRANPGLISATPPDGDPDSLLALFVVYHRTGNQTADGAWIYSCLP